MQSWARLSGSLRQAWVSRTVAACGWCEYYEEGTVTGSVASEAFPEDTPVTNMGYWNMLYDQLGDEGFDYAADGTGYSPNLMNWNAADAMQANNDYGSGSPFMRLYGGYSQLSTRLASKITKAGGEHCYGQRLAELRETADREQTICYFTKRQERVTRGDCRPHVSRHAATLAGDGRSRMRA